MLSPGHCYLDERKGLLQQDVGQRLPAYVRLASAHQPHLNWHRASTSLQPVSACRPPAGYISRSRGRRTVCGGTGRVHHCSAGILTVIPVLRAEDKTPVSVCQVYKHTQTQQQRPESPTVTLTWHGSKYKVHKLLQRYIL